jgi:hypothetical protein
VAVGWVRQSGLLGHVPLSVPGLLVLQLSVHLPASQRAEPRHGSPDCLHVRLASPPLISVSEHARSTLQLISHTVALHIVLEHALFALHSILHVPVV